MPYRRKPAAKKKFVPRRNYRNRGKGFENAVKRVISRAAEPKSHTVAVTEVAGNTLTSVSAYSINSVSQGNTSTTRNGKHIYQKMIDIRGHIHASYATPIYHKFILLAQNAQSDPAVDLFENDTGQFGPASGDIKDIYARVNTNKYQILATRTVKTGTMSNTANDANSAQMFHIFKKCPMPLEFEIGGTNPQKKWVRLLVFSRRADNDSTLGEATELTFNSKMYYNDF